ncbi:subtilase-type protease inhibitor [Streptomyces sp. NPDC059070]|uniref:subtilase-type protease inhibitor n=1 Tax=Streptomyces sp. NPDC059070 TaxID=3346713 RepID=UPI003678A487
MQTEGAILTTRKSVPITALSAVAVTTAALVWGSAPASAAPEPAAPRHAPTALVLTVGRGETVEATSPDRAVTLTCGYAPAGTHPTPAAACDALQTSRGELAALTPASGQFCTFIYLPVTVTLQGSWRGHRVDEARTFANNCVKDLHGPLVRF